MNNKVRNILEWIACIIVAVVLALTIKYFFATPTVVKSISMKDTLVEGQKLILDRTQRTFKKEISRGDILTFEAPSNSRKVLLGIDEDNPIAQYEEVNRGIVSSFVYNVLELTKISYIKRVIALPGEHVNIEDGKVYINGKELDEPYLKDGVKTIPVNFNDFTVPEGTVFLMGDNRQNSTDCRTFGCIPIEKIESKVWIRIWPLNLFGEV